MENRILKCKKCGEVFGCLSNTDVYHCSICAYYNECRRDESPMNKLEILIDSKCIFCQFNSNLNN